MRIIMQSVFLYIWVLFVFVITSFAMPKPGIHSDDPIEKKEALSNLFHMLMKKFLMMHIAPTFIIVVSFITKFTNDTVLCFSIESIITALSILCFFTNLFFLILHRPSISIFTKSPCEHVYEYDKEGNLHLSTLSKWSIFTPSLIIFCFFAYATLKVLNII